MSGCEDAVRTEELGQGLKIYVSASHVFTSDALLLSEFSHPRHRDKVCDLGAGCGIIPMLQYRDYLPKENTGVELSENAAELFNRTLSENGLIGKISCIHADMRKLKGILPHEYYDVVTVNPPYKKQGAGLVNSDEDYKNARHEFNCTLEDCVCAAAGLLRWGGRLCMCHRPERLCDIIAAMRLFGIEPKVMQTVVQREGKEPSLILIEGRKGGNSGFKIMPVFYVEDCSGGYSAQASEIFNRYKQDAKGEQAK